MTESANLNRKRINVGLVERHRLVRESLRMLIDVHPLMRVVGEGPSCASLVAHGDTQPDVVVLSDDLDSDEALLETAAEHGEARWLVLTACADPAIQIRAIRLGASGLVGKDQPAAVFHKAIEKVHDGEAWVGRSMVVAILSEISRPDDRSTVDIEDAGIDALTDRERQVMELLVEGLKTRKIAERLLISEATVRHHITSIFSKLEVSDRLGLIVFAYGNGMARKTA